MGKFYVHKDGVVRWAGVCPDGDEALQAPPGFGYGLGDPPARMIPDTRLPDPGYAAKRAREYPSIGDQLDAIWKLVGSLGTDATPARDMLAKIEEVKARFPKPSN